MLTVGVDLASQDKNTAICTIAWSAVGAHVESIVCCADDAAIIDACNAAEACGIDAPFGWPDAFVKLLATGDQEEVPWSDTRSKELRLRRTDHHAHARAKRQPLSVSSDRIALATFRVRSVLARMNVTDRSGADGRFFEVWPSGFRRVLGWEARKVAARVDARAELERVRAALPWLTIDSGTAEEACGPGAGDHVVDALVAAVAARAAKQGLTDRPNGADVAIAAREGWIHLPKEDFRIASLLK